MSFEESGSDSVELASGLWHINYGPQAPNCQDQWYIGTATHSDGKRSIYIVSDDSTGIPRHGTQADLQFIYRDMQFVAGRPYTISFDWLNSAKSDSAALYVGYFAYQTGTTPSSRSSLWKITANSTSGAMPSGLTSTNCTQALYGQSTWQNYTFKKLTAQAGYTYRFFIAFANKGNVSTRGYAACVDNIQITNAYCTAPTNITSTAITCDTIQISWEGSANSYDVKYRKSGYSQWSTASYSTSMGNTCLLEGLEEGSYEVRIRGVYYDAEGNPLYSAYTKMEKDMIVYCADKHCINYSNLESSDVICTTGDHYDGWNVNPQVAYETVGVVDYGSTDMRSRHTTNWDLTAKDPRTGNKLSLVPSGSLVSVRLGNWETGAEAEGIAYHYTVDSSQAILLLKYAVVLEDPGHTAEEQPRLTIEILDENGVQIDPDCGFVNFAANSKAPGWNTYGSGYSLVTWKDWTTIGLNLQPYVGQDLTIRLATYDCSQSGHYGYAYFTLDCASATIESHSCGSNFRLEASAPSGFLYEWTDDQGRVVGREQDINIKTEDSTMYYCKLTSTENEDCNFQLTVMALPRFPMVRSSWVYNPRRCENIIDFRDSSFVQTRYHGDTINHYNQKMVAYEWDFGDGSDVSAMPNCSHTYPDEGGTYLVRQTVWLAEGEDDCSATQTFLVTVPAIGDSLLVNRDTICNGDYIYYYGKRIYGVPGRVTSYVHRDTTWTGCVNTDSLYLFAAPKNTVNLRDTTLCYGTPYCIGDTCYTPTSSGTFAFAPKFLNRFGCDSIVSIHLTYRDEVAPDSLIVEKLSDTASYATIYVDGMGYDYYTIGTNPTHHTEGWFTEEVSKKGDTVKSYVTYYNDIACTAVRYYRVDPNCLNVVQQRWTDVLFVDTTQSHRGFVAFQWYDEQGPIPGATASYYYAGDGSQLVKGEKYYCRITLVDGIEQQTCPVEADVPEQQQNAAPRKFLQNGNFYIRKGDAIYDAYGNHVK